MPATHFICPDSGRIDIQDCLQPNGCRMERRCATMPYLRMISYDRKWRGVSPSAAGTGPRLLYLKATIPYAIDPQDRTFAALGTAVHEKLSIHKYTHNVLSEEKLTADGMTGIADVLEQDEENPGKYLIYDYKTWGSFKVCKAIGIKKEYEQVLDDQGNPVLYKSGLKKGMERLTPVITQSEEAIDLYETELQLNRYRLFFENYGFPISRIQVQAIIRDGNTAIAKSRGIHKNLMIIDIKKLPDADVIAFYGDLTDEVNAAFRDGYIRKCNDWETWGGTRCKSYCEVKHACDMMGDYDSKQATP